MELLALATEVLGAEAVAQALLVTPATVRKTWRHRTRLPPAKRRLLDDLMGSARDLPPPTAADPSVIGRGNMTREAWNALLKAQKVLRPGAAPASVQRMLVRAIDSAAQESAESGQRAPRQRQRGSA